MKTQLHSYLQHRLQCTTPQYPRTTMLSTNIPYAMYSGVLLRLLVDLGMFTEWKNNGFRVQFSCLFNNKDQLHGEEAGTYLHAGAPPSAATCGINYWSCVIFVQHNTSSHPETWPKKKDAGSVLSVEEVIWSQIMTHIEAHLEHAYNFCSIHLAKVAFLRLTNSSFHVHKHIRFTAHDGVMGRITSFHLGIKAMLFPDPGSITTLQC